MCVPTVSHALSLMTSELTNCWVAFLGLKVRMEIDHVCFHELSIPWDSKPFLTSLLSFSTCADLKGKQKTTATWETRPGLLDSWEARDGQSFWSVSLPGSTRSNHQWRGDRITRCVFDTSNSLTNVIHACPSVRGHSVSEDPTLNYIPCSKLVQTWPMLKS